MPKLTPQTDARVAFLLQSDFVSNLPRKESIERAYADPYVSHLLDPASKQLGSLLTENGADLFQRTFAILGSANVVPEPLVGNALRVLSLAGQNQAAGAWVDFAMNAASSSIDIAMDAIGAIPVIGWIAKVAFTIVNFAVQSALEEKPLPPSLGFSSVSDQERATHALTLLRSGDVTDLFRPVGRGGWRRRGLSETFNFSPSPSGGMGGCLGGFVGSISFEIEKIYEHGKAWQDDEVVKGTGKFTHPLEFDKVCKSKPLSELMPDFLPGQLADSSCKWDEISFDWWVRYPSLQRIVSGCWASLSSNSLPTMYSIDIDRCVSEWADWEESLWEYINNTSEVDSNQFAAWLALKRIAATVSNWQLAPYLKPGKPTFALLNAEYGRILRQRQFKALNTLVCAWASERQPAFRRSASLRKRLFDRRKMLLDHPARFDVDLDDVPDADYRSALATSRMVVGTSFTAKQPKHPRSRDDQPATLDPSLPRPPKQPRMPLPRVPPSLAPAPSGTSGSVLGLGMMAAGAYLFWKGSKK